MAPEGGVSEAAEDTDMVYAALGVKLTAITSRAVMSTANTRQGDQRGGVTPVGGAKGSGSYMATSLPICSWCMGYIQTLGAFGLLEKPI